MTITNVVAGPLPSTVNCAACGTQFHWTGMITIYRGQIWCAWCVLSEPANHKGEDARQPTSLDEQSLARRAGPLRKL